MGFLDDVLTAVKTTWYTFQAGPGAGKRRTGRPKVKFTRRPPIVPKKEKTEMTVVKPEREARSGRPPKQIVTSEAKYLNRSQETADWEEKKSEKNWNEVLDTPQQRVERIETEAVKEKVKKNRRFFPVDMPKKRKHLLFMNPGDVPIKEAIRALAQNTELPVWTTPFRDQLVLKGGRLYFDGLPMATKKEKRHAVKKLYFDPKESIGIVPITDTLRKKYANISKTNVTHILRSIETYQRNFGRRLPPKVLGRMSILQPGIIAMDMFFTSKDLGWVKSNCLSCMDCWSRYCHVYVLESKKFDNVLKAMEHFLQEFASFGFPPRRILADKGSDMAPAKKAMEKYRKPRDKGHPMVFNSVTGTAINIVERFNAEVQAKMQVFRTSKLTDDPSVILDDISQAINNQKRPDRGNLTPIQLLTLNKDERLRVNEMYTDRTKIAPPGGLKPLPIGTTVRVLMMTRKQQAGGGIGAKYKGFAPKWSKDRYTILKRTGLQKNPGVFRYFVGLHQSYYRHELLRVPKNLDKEVPSHYLTHKQKVIAEEEYSEEDDYYPSDDSRAA